MRWLLLKDLQILRRSPLQAVLLVAYPILIAVLVGFAISRGPEKPRVAFLNEVPAGSRVSVGGQQLPAIGVDDRICARVECVHVARPRRSRRRGQVRRRPGGADPARGPGRQDQLALDPDPGDRPRSKCSSTRRTRSRRGWSTTRISTLLAEANLADRPADRRRRRHVPEPADQRRQLPGARPDRPHPRPAGDRRDPRPRWNRRCRRGRCAIRCDQVDPLRRPRLATTSTSPGPLIERLAQPIEVDKEVVSGSSPPLEIFAIAVAATLTLAFVTVLLVAGSLALEREENAFPRLTRGLVSPAVLLVEKVVLGVVVGLAVTLLMLAGLQPFVPLALGADRALAAGDPRGRRRRWRRPGRRSGRRRARCARSPCSPSW